jgi:LacI family transcriptional regulator
LHTERSDTFASLVRGKGFSCELIAPDSLSEDWLGRQQALSEWLKKLTKPAGVLAFEGGVARDVAAACQAAGIRVPEEVAILSVGDELACEMAWPAVSAIDMDRQRTGWEAAAMLNQLMSGQTLLQRRVVVNPRGIIQRLSTETLAVDDPRVVEAVRFIRKAVADGVRVEDVLDEVPVSRRTLEYAFNRALGRSIHQEITRERIRLTQEMLATTDLALADIAARCGFSDRTRLSSIFHRETGVTPKDYRRSARRGRGAASWSNAD